MYTTQAKVSVAAKTLITAFEKGEVKSLNVHGAEEVVETKPQHPELYHEELATPGTAKKLLLAFELKKQESESLATGDVKPAGRLSVERFISFENKSATVEKQSNGFVNGNGEIHSGEAAVKIEKTEVKGEINAENVKLSSSNTKHSVEKTVVEITKEVNGIEQTVEITATTVSTANNEIKEEIREKINEEIRENIEERIEEAVQEKIVEKVEQKVEEKLEERRPEAQASTLEAHLDKTDGSVQIEVHVEVTNDKKLEEKVQEKVVEKIEEKVEEKVKEVVEEKIEKQIKENIRENIEEKVEEVVEKEIKKEVEVSTSFLSAEAEKSYGESVTITKEVKVIKTADNNSNNNAHSSQKTTLIISAVKPDGGVDATLRYATMKTLEDLGHKIVFTDTQSVVSNQRGPADFLAERKKLLEADFVIIHFRPILNSPPAALKSWLERVLIQEDETFIDKTLLKGKKAIVLISTDGDSVPEDRLLSLPFLSSVQEDILRAIALDVISPFIIFGAGPTLDELAQKHHVDAWVKRLTAIFV